MGINPQVSQKVHLSVHSSFSAALRCGSLALPSLSPQVQNIPILHSNDSYTHSISSVFAIKTKTDFLIERGFISDKQGYKKLWHWRAFANSLAKLSTAVTLKLFLHGWFSSKMPLSAGHRFCSTWSARCVSTEPPIMYSWDDFHQVQVRYYFLSSPCRISDHLPVSNHVQKVRTSLRKRIAQF